MNTHQNKTIFHHKGFAYALREIGAHMDDRGGFLIMTGPSGSGKTTVLREQYALRDQSQHQLCYVANGVLSVAGIYRILTSELALPIRGTLAENARLITQTLSGRTRRFSLLIDEAHTLDNATLDEIRILSESDLNHGPLFDIILSGLPVLKEHVRAPEMAPLKRRLSTWIELRGLKSDEIRPFTDHQLGAHADCFSSDVLSIIFEHTRGVPALMLTILKALTRHYPEQKIMKDQVEEWLELNQYYT